MTARIIRWLGMLMLMAMLPGCARMTMKVRALSNDPNWAPKITDGLTVRTGQGLRYEVEVRPGAYVYILSIGASGQGAVLFPAPGGPDARHFVPAGQPLPVPAQGWITVAPPAGNERVIFVAAGHPIAELDAVVGRPRLEPGWIEQALERMAARRMADYKVVRRARRGKVTFRCTTRETEPELVGEVGLVHQE